jgi:hypothetical protein
MEWIRVEYKLPPINEMVIGYTSEGRMVITWVDRGSEKFDTQEINEWEYFTHWHYLPEPPKKADELVTRKQKRMIAKNGEKY